MNAIQIKNVTKQYKDITALDDVSFSFEHGKMRIFLVTVTYQRLNVMHLLHPPCVLAAAYTFSSSTDP